jgi:hypothetical protein
MSRYRRALKLFEFEVSLFDGEAFDRLIAGRNSNRLNRARIFAIIKILEKVERDLMADATSVISFEKIAAHPEYRPIFDMFLANGGWTQMLKTSSMSYFDDMITDLRKEAQTATDIIDFSYRFSKKPPSVTTARRKVPGGAEAAKYVVEKCYPFTGGQTTIKTRWSRYRSASIFLYLILGQNFKLQPPELSSSQFVDKLFQQTEDIVELKRYFRAYQLVRDALSKLNYKRFLPLDLELRSSTPELSAHPFPTNLVARYSDWANNK